MVFSYVQEAHIVFLIVPVLKKIWWSSWQITDQPVPEALQLLLDQPWMNCNSLANISHQLFGQGIEVGVPSIYDSLHHRALLEKESSGKWFSFKINLSNCKQQALSSMTPALL